MKTITNEQYRRCETLKAVARKQQGRNCTAIRRQIEETLERKKAIADLKAMCVWNEELSE